MEIKCNQRTAVSPRGVLLRVLEPNTETLILPIQLIYFLQKKQNALLE